jgi:hypothetical protein
VSDLQVVRRVVHPGLGARGRLENAPRSRAAPAGAAPAPAGSHSRPGSRRAAYTDTHAIAVTVTAVNDKVPVITSVCSGQRQCREYEAVTRDWVAPGRCRPGAPADPYVLALEHTVPRVMGSLRGGKRNARCAREPADSAGACGGIGSSSAIDCGCGDRATSASGAQPPKGTAITPRSCR